MNDHTPPPQRRVILRLSDTTDHKPLPELPPEALELLFARARAAGIPLHHDPQIGAVLASLRLRDDIPTLLYAATAAVLACVYEAAEEPG